MCCPSFAGSLTFWTLYLLARTIVGAQQAVLAVLLTMTVTAFSSPGLEFGPLVAARPLWALLLLHSWQLIGQGRHNAWFAWSIEAGLLLLTTPAAFGLLLLIAGFALASERGRRTLRSFDPLFALLVIAVLALPYLIWLIRADAFALPAWPAIADLSARALHWTSLLGGLLLAMSGLLILVVLNSGWFSRTREEAPNIFRPPVEPLARDFVYFFAIAPALAGSLIAGLFDFDRVVGGAGVALLMSGLAAIVAERRSHSFAAPAPVARGLARRDRRARVGGGRDHVVRALDRHERGRDLAAGAVDRAVFRRKLRAADQSAAAGGRGRRAGCEPGRARLRASASAA